MQLLLHGCCRNGTVIILESRVLDEYRSTSKIYAINIGTGSNLILLSLWLGELKDNLGKYFVEVPSLEMLRFQNGNVVTIILLVKWLSQYFSLVCHYKYDINIAYLSGVRLAKSRKYWTKYLTFWFMKQPILLSHWHTCCKSNHLLTDISCLLIVQDLYLEQWRLQRINFPLIFSTFSFNCYKSLTCFYFIHNSFCYCSHPGGGKTDPNRNGGK